VYLEKIIMMTVMTHRFRENILIIPAGFHIVRAGEVKVTNSNTS
jgi:hypothetical protein